MSNLVEIESHFLCLLMRERKIREERKMIFSINHAFSDNVKITDWDSRFCGLS